MRGLPTVADEPSSQPRDGAPAIIQTRGLTKRYGGIAALDRLDLDVYAGEVLGCLGPNGAGKTTLIRLLLGLIHATAGDARIFGLDARKRAAAIHARIAYVPGESTLWPALTGAETLELLAKIHGRIDVSYRKQLVERFAFDPSRRVRAYSKGNRQKINLIAAFASRAELLILDEPTSGLDPLMEEAFRVCVHEAKANGQTVFLSSHILAELEVLCDRIAILRGGRLVEVGTLAEMRHLSAVTVEATFAGSPPDVHGVSGVSNITVTRDRLSCQVHGRIAPLLTVLAAARPVSLLAREPSLEELFLALYGRDAQETEGLA